VWDWRRGSARPGQEIDWRLTISARAGRKDGLDQEPPSTAPVELGIYRSNDALNSRLRIAPHDFRDVDQQPRNVWLSVFDEVETVSPQPSRSRARGGSS
jgi:hypothetical protein